MLLFSLLAGAAQQDFDRLRQSGGYARVALMQFTRVFSKKGQDPYAKTTFRSFDAEDGRRCLLPESWSLAACALFVERAFYKGTVPALVLNTGEAGVPRWLSPSRANEAQLESVSAQWRYTYETDVRQVIDRVAGGLTHRGWRAGLFGQDEEQAEIFYDELRCLMVRRGALLESAILAVTGLDWAYGLTPRPPCFSQQIKDPVSAADAAGSGFDFSSGKNEKSQDVQRRLTALSNLLALQQARALAIMPGEDENVRAFAVWKAQEDLRAAAVIAGQKTLEHHLNEVIDACDREDYAQGFDPAHNDALYAAVRAATRAGVPSGALAQAIDRARDGDEFFPVSLPLSTAHLSLSTALCFKDDLVEAALTDSSVAIETPCGSVRHLEAAALWEQAVQAAWATGDPAFLFSDAVRQTQLVDSKKSMFMALQGGFVFSAPAVAPSALLNLAALTDDEIAPAVQIMITALDLTLAAPLGDVDAATLYARPLALGFSGLDAYLMAKGYAYDSAAARAQAADVTAIITVKSFETSADLAQKLGPCPNWRETPGPLLAALKKRVGNCVKKLSSPQGIQAWKALVPLVQKQGLRNLCVTAQNGIEAEHLMLGAPTLSVLPEKDYLRSSAAGIDLAPSVRAALKALGYDEKDLDSIYRHATGHRTLKKAPGISFESLAQKAFVPAVLESIEHALATATDLRHAFGKWTLGEDFCAVALGLDPESFDDPNFDLLTHIGFSEAEIQAAQLYCCGAGSLVDAPALRAEHKKLFAREKNDPKSCVRMIAAIDAQLCGACAVPLELDRSILKDQVENLARLAWEERVKTLRLYRQGCSVSSDTLVAGQEQESFQGDLERLSA